MTAAQWPFVAVSVLALLAALYLTYERDYGRPRWVSRMFGGRGR
jgi:hypothetical protein